MKYIIYLFLVCLMGCSCTHKTPQIITQFEVSFDGINYTDHFYVTNDVIESGITLNTNVIYMIYRKNN